MTDNKRQENAVLEVASSLDQMRISPDLLLADFADLDFDLFSADFPRDFSNGVNATADDKTNPIPTPPTSPSRKRGADPRSMEMNPHKQNTIAGGYGGPSASFQKCNQSNPFVRPVTATFNGAHRAKLQSSIYPEVPSSLKKRSGGALLNMSRFRPRLGLKNAAVECKDQKRLSTCGVRVDHENFCLSNQFGIVKCFRDLGGSLLERLAAFGTPRGNFILALGLPWQQTLLSSLIAAVRNVTFRKHCYDEHVRSLTTSCPSLMSIKLKRCNGITDKSLHYLSACRQLHTLDISFCRKITDEGLRALACTQSLRCLDLSGSRLVTESGLVKFLGRCEDLRSINVSYCVHQVTDQVLECLSGCLQLRDANFTDCVNVTDHGLLLLTSKCTTTSNPLSRSLRTVSLYNCKRITDAGLHSLARCPDLCSLDIFNCALVTDSPFRDLASNCLNLSAISLRRCTNITGKCLRELATLAQLQVLDVSFCSRLDGEALMHLCRCPRLHTLKLAHCTRVTLDSLQQLVSCCPIRALDISYCHKRLSLCELPPYVKLETCRKLQDEAWKFL